LLEDVRDDRFRATTSSHEGLAQGREAHVTGVAPSAKAADRFERANGKLNDELETVEVLHADKELLLRKRRRLLQVGFVDAWSRSGEPGDIGCIIEYEVEHARLFGG
jgi:hypothetical protein